MQASNDPPSKYQSRKFLIASAACIFSTSLLISKHINSNNWVDANKWIGCTYMTANAANNVVVKPAYTSMSSDSSAVGCN